tara:strand:+ start:392 stop:694 length:303 start_codon:yes stop_codon:yes gene_type:complete
MSLIIKFWNGDVTLWKSYWLVGVIIGNLIAFIVGFIYYFLINGYNDETVALLLSPFLIYLLVGIWRSAGKYTGHKAWAYSARFFTIIGILSGLGNLLGGG